MRAARIAAKPHLPVHVPPVDGTVAVLREVVAQLAERIELLEANVSLVRRALDPARSRRRSSS